VASPTLHLKRLRTTLSELRLRLRRIIALLVFLEIQKSMWQQATFEQLPFSRNAAK